MGAVMSRPGKGRLGYLWIDGVYLGWWAVTGHFEGPEALPAHQPLPRCARPPDDTH
jgi:hypothetical protein